MKLRKGKRLGAGLLSVACALALSAAPARSQPPVFHTEITKSLARIELPKNMQATAVCLHENGLFATALANVRELPPFEKFKLLVGAVNPARFDAYVVARDETNGLALLKAGSSGSVQPIKFVEAEKLPLPAELTLASFGMELGSIGRNLTPAQAVKHWSSDQATAPRLQLARSHTKSSFGAAAVISTGEVAGMLVSVGDQPTSNVVLTDAALRKYLQEVTLHFAPPVLRNATLAQPADFRVTLVDPAGTLQAADDLQVQLVLSGPGQPKREFAMQRNKLDFTQQAVPFPQRKSPARVQAELDLNGDALSAALVDQVFRVGGSTISFGELRSLKVGATAEAELVSGIVQTGRLEDLGPLTAHLGGQELRLVSSKLTGLKVRPLLIPPLYCQVTVNRGPNALKEARYALRVNGVPFASLAELNLGHFVRPQLAAAPTTYFRTHGYAFELRKAGSPTANVLGKDHVKVASADLHQVSFHLGDENPATLALVSGPRFALTVGQYARVYDAQRKVEAEPDLTLTGANRIVAASRFTCTIWELEFGPDRLLRAALDFIQWSSAKDPVATGMLRYNSTLE